MNIDLKNNKTQLAVLIALVATYMLAGSWIGRTTAVALLVCVAMLAGWATLKYTGNATYAFVASGLAGVVLHFSGAFDKFATIGANIGGAIQTGLWIGLVAFCGYQAYLIFGSQKKG